MEATKLKVLTLLMETGSTTASEIRTFGAKDPYYIISSLRKMGVLIKDCKIWGNEKVYYLPKCLNKR